MNPTQHNRTSTRRVWSALLTLLVALAALIISACATPIGAWGCPAGTLNRCPDGYKEICETTDQGRCCTCEPTHEESSQPKFS